MKEKIIKQISVASAITLMVSNLLPTFIYASNTTKDSIGSINQEDDGINIGIDKTQNQKTTYSEDIEDNGNQSADVYVSQASTFCVFIPKTIILDGKVNEEGVNKANYIVRVSEYSNIGGLETIDVIPDKEFTLSQLGKNDIKATIIQDKEQWKYNEIAIYGNGEISTIEMSAGSWNGQFNFNIFLHTSFIKVEAFDENGVDLEASAKEIKGERKEELLNSLVDTGMISNKEDVDLLIDVNSNDFNNIANTIFEVSKIAKEGEQVAILHFDEITQEWEYIGTETVNEECKVTANFTSFSPVAFVKVKEDGSFENIEQYVEIELNTSNYYWTRLPKSGNVIIPETFTYQDVKYKIIGIGGALFYRCTGLTNITIPKSVKYIGSQVFEGCTGLTKIEIPDSVTTMGTSVFNECTNLSEVKLPNNLKTIDTFTFYKCKNLKSIEFPDSVTTIGEGAFKETGLINIVIPKNITTLYNYAFSDCSNVETIDIPETVTNMGNWVFYQTTGVATINCNIRNSGYTNLGAFYETNFTKVIIKESVSSIGGCAFYGCKSLKEIIIPTSVKSIGQNAFESCSSLSKINYKGTINEWNFISFENYWNYSCPATIVYNYVEE